MTSYVVLREDELLVLTFLLTLTLSLYLPMR